MLFVGKIKKIRGNRGEVVVETSFPEPFRECRVGDIAILKSKKHTLEKIIETARWIHGTMVVKFMGIESIGEALALVGSEMHLVSAPTPRTTTSVRARDLVGYEVRDMNGETWGHVRAVSGKSGHFLLEVGKAEILEPILVPFQPQIVSRLDPDKRLIWIDPPPGLKELNL